MEVRKPVVCLQIEKEDQPIRTCYYIDQNMETDPLTLSPSSADGGTGPDIGESILPEDFETRTETDEPHMKQIDGDNEDIIILKKEGVDTCEEVDVKNEHVCINSGKSTTLFPRPPLMSTVNLMDTKYCSFQDRSCCSNCYKQIYYESEIRGKKFADILCSRKSTTSAGRMFGVTVLEALEVIFELQKKSCLSEIILDEMEYVMCWKCCSILSKLYELYIEFAECSRSPSYTKSIMSHNKCLMDHHKLIQKYRLDVTCRRNEVDEDEDDGPHLNFEVSFLEEDNSYSPPTGETWTHDITPMEVVSTRNLRKRRCAPEQYIKEEEEDTNSLYKSKSTVPPVKRGRGRPRRVPIDVKPLPTQIASKMWRKRTKDKRREKDRRLIHKCKECSVSFSRPSRLQRHANIHSERKYVCSVCDAGFKFPIYLERHEATHTSEKRKDDANDSSESDFEDEHKVKKSQIMMSRVKGNVTREDRRRAHVCRHCGLVFTKPSGLAHHARLHKNTIYACDQLECTKEFKSKAVLTRHKVKFHEMNPEEAEVEDRKPFVRKIIKRHIPVSDDENDEFYVQPKRGKDKRKFKCPDCPQTFFRSDHVKRHANVHVEKNNFCDTCLAGFATFCESFSAEISIRSVKFNPSD